MDNVDTQETPMDNVDTQTLETPVADNPVAWKSHLGSDIANSPLVQKFSDDIDGLNQAFESYGNLEKLLGHEKVPIPQGDDDVEGWNRFSKAMGIPEKSVDYGLNDVEMPENMQGMAMNKEQFAEVVHAHKLTPSQASGLWDTYNKMNVEAFQKAVEGRQASVKEAISRLRGEWGDAYDTNIELGQMVINKFSDDQDMNDFITASLAGHPLGSKFLAKIGNEFAENKIGTFQMKRFSLAPEQAMDEIQKITSDPNHPYNDPKAPDREHQAAIDYVNNLYSVVNRGQGQP